MKVMVETSAHHVHISKADFEVLFGKDAKLNCIVTDKDVRITDGVNLSGNDNMPFYVQKGRKI